MHWLQCAVLACLAGTTLGQSYVVSPVGLSATEGSSSSLAPFLFATAPKPWRYQQIHSDLTGPMLINEIAFRMNGSNQSFAGSVACDMEMLMAESRPHDDPKWVFSQNYIGLALSVLPRQVINWGPLTAGRPAPFEMAVPLANPFPYSGTHSLVWDTTVHGVTLTAPFPSEIDLVHSSYTHSATPAITGQGCRPSGQAAFMRIGFDQVDSGGIWVFGHYVIDGPANAAVVLALGVTNPNTSIPGLCGPLLTDLTVVLPGASTDANGGSVTYLDLNNRLPTPRGPSVYATPNVLPGATLYVQAHALDAGQPNVPITNSNGISIVVPTIDVAIRHRVTMLYNDYTRRFPLEAMMASRNNIGYGVVTRFGF